MIPVAGSSGRPRSQMVHERSGADAIPELSIVVPAYNEAQRLPHALPRLCAAVADQPWEVILVDDCSTDATAAVATDLLASLHRGRVVQLDRHRGKGAAVRAGVADAIGEKIMFMDADLATDLIHIPEMVAHLEHHDVVIASRNAPGAVTSGLSPARANMSRIFRLLARWTIGLPLTDSQCGFKGFRAPLARTVFHLVKEEGLAFDVEVLALVHALGVEIYEMPVRWVEVRGSQIRIVSDSVGMLRDVGRIARRYGRDSSIHLLSVRTVEPDDALMGSLQKFAPHALVLAVDGEVLVLLPFVDHTAAVQICQQLRDALPADHIDLHRLPIEELLSPDSQPMRSALLAAGLFA